MAVVCTAVGLVLSLLIVFRHCDSSLFARLVPVCLSQFPAASWLPLFFLKPGKSFETGSTQNLQRKKSSQSNKVHIHRNRLYCSDTCRLSADLIVNRFLLLLLQFSPPSFFPIICLPLFPSPELRGTFGSPEDMMGFPFPVEDPATCGTVWKNLCLAA